jgi:hypothetical protein
MFRPLIPVEGKVTPQTGPFKNKIHIEMDVFVIGKSYFLSFLISNKTIKPKNEFNIFSVGRFSFLNRLFFKRPQIAYYHANLKINKRIINLTSHFGRQKPSKQIKNLSTIDFK